MSLAPPTNAARQLADGRLTLTPITALPDPPVSEQQAYVLQQGVHQVLTADGRGEVVGHQIGCTTEVMQRYLDIAHPCAGGVLGASVHHDHATLRCAEFQRVGVECEVAVRLGRDVVSADDVDSGVDAVLPAIEIVDDRYADFSSLGAMTLIADDFFGAGCVLGAPVHDWRKLDLAALTGAMHINGQLAGAGIGSDILGHPFNALRWLAGQRLRSGQPQRAGELVLLGSVVKTVWLAPGDEVQVHFPGLGGASLSLA